MNESNLTTNITDINESDFEEKVLKESSSFLILVDFWAPWCGPCKQLTPLLEKVINQSNKKVKLVKINIDENQQIASQLRIQSIPAVFAFKDGQPINAFQGVIPEKNIIEFIEKCLGEKILEDHSNFYVSIDELIAENNFIKAKELLENFITENPKEFKAFAIFIDCLSSLEQYEEAEIFCDSLDKEVLANDSVKSSIKKLLIKKKNNDGPSLKTLEEEFKKKPNDIEIILKLSDKYFAKDMIDEAFNLLLSNYIINKEKIKNKFLNFFEALGNENEKTIQFRKKLSSIMFS